jgi:hypothetical protein
MIADKNTIYIAYNNDKTIVHQGYVFQGESMDSGLPIKEYFYNKSLFLKRLIELELNNDVDFSDWVEPTLDTTPPTLYGLGVVIPDTFIWVFPDNKFILEGFEIPLTNGAVDIAYFQWQAFRDCLDNGNHDYLKRALMPLWDYVAEQVENQNFVQL